MSIEDISKMYKTIDDELSQFVNEWEDSEDNLNVKDQLLKKISEA